MKIDVSSIVKIDGASLKLEFEERIDGLNDISEDHSFDDPVYFKGQVENHSGILNLTGTLKTSYKTVCYRCLNGLEASIRIGIDEDFCNSKNSEDLEDYTYEGNFVELDKVFIDNIMLNLPVRQACSDDCKGLCPECGINLNKEKCKCGEESVDTRMEVLKNFFNN